MLIPIKAFYTRYRKAKPNHAFLIFQAYLSGSLIFLLGIWRLYNGQPLHFTFDATLSLSFFIMGYIGSFELYHKNIARLFAITYTLAVWAAIQFLGVVGLYWSFAALVATYFVARRQEAVVVSMFTYCIAIYGVYKTASPEVLLSYTAVYILMVFYCYQFSERLVQDNNRLSQEANLDALTGLPNRRALDDFINDIVTDPKKYSGKRCLMLLDIDHFKLINDQYGHTIGDLVLSRLGPLIQKFIGDRAVAFRYGGEEFILITKLPLVESGALAEEVRIFVEDAKLLREHNTSLTVSIGVAEWSGDEDSRSWFKRADDALYKAKRSGRNRVWLSDE